MDYKSLSTNKKIAVLILAIISIILVLFTVFYVLIRDGQRAEHDPNPDFCDHSWSAATCTTPSTCDLCGETNGEPSGHNFMEATCLQPKTCIDCGLTEGEYGDHDMAGNTCINCGFEDKDASDWNFYDLSDMDYALVDVFGYDLNDSSNKMVYVEKNTNILKFEGGYCLDWGFNIKDGNLTFENTSNPRTYSVVNEENIMLSGNESLSITETKTTSSYPDFVTFVISEKDIWDTDTDWYVPYSLIDWSRAPGTTTTDDGNTYTVLYLK